MRRTMILVALLALFGVAPLTAKAQSYPYYHKRQWYPRQYSYRGKRHTYYYTHYYYKPKQYHHVYYYPSRSRRYAYYYNWRSKKYWGRCDLATGKYSLLPDDKKKENLDDIKEEDFPPPVPLEKIGIPGSDGLKMTAPPPFPTDIPEPQP